jgi:glycosyltransferase involved in cell wall biosynthesis
MPLADTRKIKLSILSHDLSGNCLGRAHILAKALQHDFDVTIFGPASTGKIWAPVVGDASVPVVMLGKYLSYFRALNEVDGEIVYAIKPRGGSFGVAILLKLIKGLPVLLDIDDWEAGFVKDLPLVSFMIESARFWNIDNPLFTIVTGWFIGFANQITVSNTFLQKKFGGTLIPHFRNPDDLNPARYNRGVARARLGVEDKKVVMFLGTVRKHKGIDTIIRALDSLNRDDVALVLVGVGEEARRFIPNRPYVKLFGPQPFEKVPEFLVAADVVALMQDPGTASAQGQLPAKIFDAMSMARPVVSTAVSDIPTVLRGCGIVIDGSSASLQDALRELFENPVRATELGNSARRRCIEEYSYEAVRPRLKAVVSGLLATSRNSKIANRS